jgi:hypothetical protein
VSRAPSPGRCCSTDAERDGCVSKRRYARLLVPVENDGRSRASQAASIPSQR